MVALEFDEGCCDADVGRILCLRVRSARVRRSEVGFDDIAWLLFRKPH
jgi:hypothetical protein